MPDILVVEDEAVLRMTFGQFLEDAGYGVATAEHFDEAMRQLESRSFDVVVTDIILGGKTGVDLLRELRARELDASVVMITGEPNVNTAAEAVRLGAFDYLAKPVDGRELLRVVRLALERRQIAKERDEYAARMDTYRRELEAIFNSVNEGIITVAPDLSVRQMNKLAAHLLDTDAEDAPGMPLAALLHGNLATALEHLRQTVEHGGAVAEFTLETALPRRGNRVLGVATAPLRNESGQQTGALLLLRDLTRLHNLERQLEAQPQRYNIIGQSPQMRNVFELVAHVAQTDTTTLICGESGTGKELVAGALHFASERAGKPFVKVNCAALSDDLLESELFGHVKGAFTGAHRDRVGRFQAADGGTILLDEIGDISPRLQMRLLRVLQEREFERVGDSRPIRVDVRVIASTNRDLPAKIAAGAFREDLYYRINVMRIDLPPLREHPEDIPPLVEHFCAKFAKRFKRRIHGVSRETLDILMRRQWPGNVRELENWLERAFVVCQGETILPEHLPQESGASHPASGTKHEDGKRLPLSREAVAAALEKTGWNIAKTARILGVSRNTLYQRIQEFGLKK